MPGMILDCFCMILKMLLTCPGPSPPYGGVYFFWRFHLASHGCSCSPGFPVKLPKGFTGSCYGVSWVSSLASGGTSPHGPYICPCYLVFQRLPSLSLNTCQALHIYVFAYFILISQATAAPLPDPRKFYSSNRLPWCHLPGVNPSAGGMQLSPFCVCLGTWIVHPYYRLGVSLHSTSWCVFSWASC